MLFRDLPGDIQVLLASYFIDGIKTQITSFTTLSAVLYNYISWTNDNEGSYRDTFYELEFCSFYEACEANRDVVSLIRNSQMYKNFYPQIIPIEEALLTVKSFIEAN